MTYDQAEIICALAECNMNIRHAAMSLHRSSSGTNYQMQLIERETGLDPHNFYDLCELLPQARAILEEENSDVH